MYKPTVNKDDLHVDIYVDILYKKSRKNHHTIKTFIKAVNKDVEERFSDKNKLPKNNLTDINKTDININRH